VDADELLERENLLHALDVLAGLAACFAAMDERQDDYAVWLACTVNRPVERVSAHWIEAA
jgi:hypothetical protein